MTEQVELKQRLSLDAHEIERRRLWSAVYATAIALSLGHHEVRACKALEDFDKAFPTPNQVYFP